MIYANNEMQGDVESLNELVSNWVDIETWARMPMLPRTFCDDNIFIEARDVAEKQCFSRAAEGFPKESDWHHLLRSTA